MAPQTNRSKSQGSFDPSRDIDSYDRIDFTSRGLKRKSSITLYTFLCRLCPPGQSRLLYDFQYVLAEDLQRLAGTRSGFRESSVTKKLQTLERHGFVRLIEGAAYCVEIIRPEDASACTRPEIGTGAADTDHQSKLFAPPEPAEPIEVEEDGGPATIPLFGPGKKRNSVSVSVSDKKRNSVSVSPSEHTSYPRTRTGASAVDDEVDVEDDSTGEVLEKEDPDPSVARRRSLGCPDDARKRAAEDVTDDEATFAKGMLLEIESRWKRVGLSMPERQRQRELDQSMIRRTCVLLHREIIPQWLFDEAVARPIDHRRQGKPVDKPVAQFTKIVFEVPWFGPVLGQVKEPLPPERPIEPPPELQQPTQNRRLYKPDPEELRRSMAEGRRFLSREAAPNGEQPQRE